MFTEKKKEEFIIIHDELDAIIKKIVMAKSEYDKHPFPYGSHTWTYDDGEFEIEVEDNYTGYRCGESETRSFTVSWEEIFDVENIIENLKKESEERERKTAEKKLINEANAQKENIASERGEYERLIIKYEKS